MAHPNFPIHRICQECFEARTDEQPKRSAEWTLAECCYCGDLRNIDLYVADPMHSMKTACGVRA